MRSTWRRISLVVALLALVGGVMALRPQEASAHPLGNFTINRYSRVEIGAGEVRVRYVLDMAEIPAFQEMKAIDLDGDDEASEQERALYLESKVRELAQGMRLSINGSPVHLIVSERQIEFPEGQGGLSTLRLSALLEGAAPRASEESALYYRDDNYARRIGWKEIVVQPREGVVLLDSTAPHIDRSNELRSYPEGGLSSPPNLLEARSRFRLGVAGESSQPQAEPSIGEPTSAESGDLLTSLLATNSLSITVVAAAFLVAMGLGALHAMSPGHGKTIMAAYLVGTRGTAVHALFLGVTVTVSHTLGVLALGLIVLYASSLIAPERLYPWLGLVSGAVIVVFGIWLIFSSIRNRGERHSHHTHGDGHSHTHPHTHAHEHTHQPSGGRLRVTWKSLTALGIVGGLVPSTSALVILLAAISLNRVGFGLALILAFSVGMAAVLASTGLLLVYARRVVERLQLRAGAANTVMRGLPMAAALVVLVSGVVLAVRGALQVGD